MKKETIFDWMANLLGIAGGFPAIFKGLRELWGNIPDSVQEQIKQKMPGFMGLSLADERIFNSLVAKLTPENQRLLMNFLYEKCKDFMRNRFINIVTGMEVVQGAPTIVEKKWNEKIRKFEERKISGKDTEDLRLKFLESFSEYIKANGEENAYEYCIAGRMVLENPFHQQAIAKWTESVRWFEKTILPLFERNFQDLTNTTTRWADKAKEWRNSAPRR